jgi:hypothetical protein
LYALFSVIEQACSTISDDDVARSKLGWWRNELEPKNLAVSQHPLVRDLRNKGGAERLRRESLDHLFRGAAKRIDAQAPADLAALHRLCTETSQPQLDLELGMVGSTGGISAGQLPGIGFVQLVRESARGTGQGAYWWMPLNLLARHKVNREEILAHPGSGPVLGLFGDLFAEVLSWNAQSGVDATANPMARHLAVISGLVNRKLARLAATQPDRFARELGRVGPADLLHAWKSARRAG